MGASGERRGAISRRQSGQVAWRPVHLLGWQDNIPLGLSSWTVRSRSALVGRPASGHAKSVRRLPGAPVVVCFDERPR